jgi:regulator of protease activity HflC (stomatin/prohibitin superfamily)
MIEGIIAAIIGVLFGATGTVVYEKRRTVQGKNSADKVIADAKIKASDVILKAKDDALDLINDAKNEEGNRRKEWQRTENR